MVRGIDHNGFALIDVYSPCPTFNKVNTFKYYREEPADLPAGYDRRDRNVAFQFANSQDPFYLGVLFEEEGDSFEDHVRAGYSGTEEDAPRVIEAVLKRLS